MPGLDGLQTAELISGPAAVISRSCFSASARIEVNEIVRVLDGARRIVRANPAFGRPTTSSALQQRF